jgi:DNA primase
MIAGNKKTKLTKETIFHKISEYDIFMFYMPDKKWRLNVVTHSPFRKENNPSFLIGNKYGSYYYIDFGDTSKRGDCFQFVKDLYSLSSMDEVLKIIDRDFGLGISCASLHDYKKIISEYKKPEIIEKSYSLIQVKTRKFTKEELAYWNNYHQDIEDLRRENIYSISKLYFNRQVFPLKETELRFGYYYDGCWKIYRPFGDKQNKWMPNNVPITTMDGEKNIQKDQMAFINKSKKDYMVIKKIYPYTCAVQNEGVACFSEKNVEHLKANSKEQILSFDSDVTGVKNSQQITQMFDFGYCNVPKHLLQEEIKDWADWSKTYGMKPIEEYLKQKQLL